MMRLRPLDLPRIRQDLDPLLADLDAAVTVEAAGVTLVGVARERAEEGDLALDGEATAFLRAAQCQDEAHYHFLLSVGAAPAATDFSLRDAALADRDAFLDLLVALEEVAVAGAMALTRAAAETGNARLVEVAYQIGAVDAQHLALARLLRGARPANDRAFVRWRFAAAAEALDALVDLGLVASRRDDPGETAVFPGPLDRVCEGIFGLVPETTDDALVPPAVGTPAGT